jgi:hypothetical protein
LKDGITVEDSSVFGNAVPPCFGVTVEASVELSWLKVRLPSVTESTDFNLVHYVARDQKTKLVFAMAEHASYRNLLFSHGIATNRVFFVQQMLFIHFLVRSELVSHLCKSCNVFFATESYVWRAELLWSAILLTSIAGWVFQTKKSLKINNVVENSEKNISSSWKSSGIHVLEKKLPGNSDVCSYLVSAAFHT